MTVDDRYYSKKEYESLSPAKKFGLKLKREKRGQKGKREKSGKSEKQSSKQNRTHHGKMQQRAQFVKLSEVQFGK
jgi:hypothetical protein